MNGNGYENGASTIRAGDSIDPTAIPATISLPTAVWERLTADLRNDDRVPLGHPELPDTPLHARIATFLEMQVAGWEGSVTRHSARLNASGDANSNLDDGLPF